MLVVRISSGMGNQLFQYTFAHYLKQRYQRPVFLDTSPFTYRLPDRTYHLDIINTLPKTKDWRLYNQYPRGLYRLAKGLFAINPTTRHILDTEPVFPPDDKLLYFDGYWQTDRYVSQLPDVHALLTPQEAPPASIARWQALMADTQAISLHIRRGDYFTALYKKRYGVCDTAYYEAAIERMMVGKENATVFVFSDEPDWVRENLRLPQNVHVIDNEPINPLWYILLMAQCKDNILSNSAFSWWGAYLNRNLDKRVVAPKRWMLDSEATLAMSSWELL